MSLLLAAILCVQDTVTLHAGRIIPVSGPEIENGFIVIEGGKIKSVGKGDGGPNAIDLGDAVIMPGIVDAGTPATLVMQTNEEASEITPDLRISKMIDPQAADFKRLRQMGVTSIYIAPGTMNVIGGLACVVKPAGLVTADKPLVAAEMIVRDDVCLVAAMGDDPQWKNFPPRRSSPSFYARRPTTRMGVDYEFRRAFVEADKSKSAANDILLRAKKGELPVRIWARRATDIETALKLGKDFGLRVQIEGGLEAHRLIDLLKAQKASVILRPHVNPNAAIDEENTEPRVTTFMELEKAGIPTAIVGRGTDEGDAPLVTAAFLRRYGADRAALLRALTKTPAELLGVSNRVGTLEAGKDADLVILSGDPLDVRSAVRAVVINGKVVHGKWSK